MVRRKEIPNLNDLIERYKSGVPLQRLSKESGYTRTVLARRLIEADVKIRSYSDGQRSRWRDVPNRTEAITQWLSRAWEATRGRIRSPETLNRQAQTRFKRQVGKWTDENRIASFLELAEIPILQQFPVGSYNLDIALDGFPVAVEIVHLGVTDFNRGRRISHNRPGKERLKYLLDRGWFVLYLIATRKQQIIEHLPNGCFAPTTGRTKRTINLGAVGKDLISWIQFARGNKSLAGYYWVIYGQGKMSSRLGYDFGECPLVPSSLCPNKIT